MLCALKFQVTNVITYDINSEKLTEEQKEVPRIWNDLSTNE